MEQHKEFDEEKLRAAIARQEEQAASAAKGETNKRKYNSLSAEVNVTEEDMEAYRLRKDKGRCRRSHGQHGRRAFGVQEISINVLDRFPMVNPSPLSG